MSSCTSEKASVPVDSSVGTTLTLTLTLRFRGQPALLQPSVILVAGASVLQQPVEDAGLFQSSEVGNVLCNNRNIRTVIRFIAFVFITVG